MKIAIGSDHRGFKLKTFLKKFLQDEGHEVIDQGPKDDASVDYPVYSLKVGESVRDKETDRGILICGSGIGTCIASNKVKGIRAVLARTENDAIMGRKHNNANILCLGADVTSEEEAAGITQKFLETDFEDGRHQRRVDIITQIEEER
ncbi:MAG: ribose 5-phosphate isomerase B [Elusimicrobiota bacterium]|nr:ribose 5-phosphate isomerase B [Elusimicrobiota bacterium]